METATNSTSRPPHSVQCILLTTVTAIGILMAIGLLVGLIVVIANPPSTGSTCDLEAQKDPGCDHFFAIVALVISLILVGSYTICCCIGAISLNVKDYRNRHSNFSHQ